MTAADAIQRRIEAQQQLDTIEYGLRSIKTCGSEYSARCYEAHACQLAEACKAGAQVLGREAIHADGSSATYWLKVAKRKAYEELVAAKAAVKEFGNVRQLRLALEGGTA